MPRSSVQRIQDSVFGLMEFEGMETSVIDVLRTPELQRLRRIRQLGLAHFVYPGAEHSRLAHSLGAAYLAIKFGRHIRNISRKYFPQGLCTDESSIRDLALAALCHDLGHGPLSHSWEREIIEEVFDFDKWINSLGLAKDKEKLRGARWHEIVTHGFLSWDEGQLAQLLEQREEGLSRRLSFLIRGHYYIPYLPRLLSSDIDVDRADYLMRDSYQCGITYGDFDLDWLISTCTIGMTKNDLVIGFDRKKAIRVLEQFLIARRALYNIVYFHKTVRCMEGMVSLFLKRLQTVISEGTKLKVPELNEPLIKLLSGEPLNQTELLSLDDFSVWVLISYMAENNIDYTLKDLAKRIVSRDLFKIVPCESDIVEKVLRRDGGRDELYKAIQPSCPGKPQSYLFVDDRSKFSMLSNKQNEFAYLIDDKQNAIALQNDSHFLDYRKETKDIIRLFTVREAVSNVKELLESKY